MIVVNHSENEKSKVSIYEKLAEPTFYPMLKEMGNSQEAIEKFQRKRVQESIFVFIALFLCGVFVSPWFYFISFVGAYFFYKSKFKKMSGKYSTWKFQRHLQFSKFTRLLIPYLKQSKGQVSLYSIFNKILMRTENEADQKALYTLMSEMSNKPNDIQPFIDYAEKSSGTDMSVLFMSTIFDFQQSTFDTTVIDELGKIASEELMTSIDEIITFKLRRFSFFPTKLVMSSIILIIGFTIGVFLTQFSALQF